MAESPDRHGMPAHWSSDLLRWRSLHEPGVPSAGYHTPHYFPHTIWNGQSSHTLVPVSKVPFLTSTLFLFLKIFKLFKAKKLLPEQVYINFINSKLLYNFGRHYRILLGFHWELQFFISIYFSTLCQILVFISKENCQGITQSQDQHFPKILDSLNAI